MSELDRTVAGITCREVLSSLSGYLDGELDAAEAARLEAHVRECDRCERFGGRFGAVIRALRSTLGGEAPAPEPGVAERLRARLEG
jgi:anti-sigma factor RsiW